MACLRVVDLVYLRPRQASTRRFVRQTFLFRPADQNRYDIAHLESNRTLTITVTIAKQRRNEKCACGSGKKYKHCCMRKEDAVHKETEVAPLILEAGRRGLEHTRSARDDAERALRKLIEDPRADESDK